MDWSAFGPLILPYATTCSVPLMKQHARLAAIEFLKHTKAWQVDLEPLTGDGVLTSFPLVLPDDAELEKLLAVTITEPYGAVSEADVRTAGGSARLARRGMAGAMANTPDRVSLTVLPAQAVDASIVATVALKPTLTAASFPDELFAQYGVDIAKGALKSLTSMANKPWTDATTARIAAAEFINAKAVTARQVERGFAKSNRQPTTRWF